MQYWQYFLRKLISLFIADPMVRLFISLLILVAGLFIVSLFPESARIKSGIGVVVFVALLNFRTVFGWIKEFFQ